MTVEEARKDFINYIENKYADDLLTIDKWISFANKSEQCFLNIYKGEQCRVNIPLDVIYYYYRFNGFDVFLGNDYVQIKWD